MTIYKPHTVKIYPDSGSELILQDLLDLDESARYTKPAEVTAPHTVPTHVAINARELMLRGSTYSLKALLDSIGVSGLGIAGSSNPGVVGYWQKFDDMGFAVSGANHVSRTYANGVIVPRSISCDHQGDAKLTFEMIVIGDGTNSPVSLSATASLPTVSTTPARWTLGPITLGGVSFSEYTGIEIDFGNNVQARGVQSYLDHTHIEQKTHEPKITITGIDPTWFSASKVPIGGLVVANATDSIYLRKRTQTATSFVPNGTAEHIKFTPAGLASMGSLGRAQAQRVGDSTIEITLAKDMSGNAPLVMSTASAIT